MTLVAMRTGFAAAGLHQTNLLRDVRGPNVESVSVQEAAVFVMAGLVPAIHVFF